MPTTNATVLVEQVDGSERPKGQLPKYPTPAPTTPTASRAIRSLWKLATFLAATTLAASAANATTIVVTGTGDTIAVDGVVTLREAITAANTNAASGDAPAGQGSPIVDVINFDIPGPGPHTIMPGSVYSLTSEMSIEGPTAESVIIDGNNLVQLFSQGSAAASSFSNLTLRGGNAGGLQGGAYQLTTPVASSAVIRNVTFEGNFASQGGAISRTNFSNLILRNCRFVNNTSNFDGGALFTGGTGTVAIEGCRFTGNSGQGAGAANIGTSATFRIENSLFQDNFTVAGPNPLEGGALLVGSGTGTIANSTFFNNRSHSSGGAVYASGGTLSLLNVTMVGNESDFDASTSALQGGAIGKTGGATVSVGNSLIAGNLDSGASNDLLPAAAFVSLGRNFIGEIGTATGFNADDADPFTGGADLSRASLGNPSLSSIYTAPPSNNGGGTNTIALTPGSPLVNAALSASLPADFFDLDGDADTAEVVPYDQRGGDGAGPASDFVRVIGGAPDIGAFEIPSFFVNVTGDLVDANLGDGICADANGDCSLRAAVAQAQASSIKLVQFDIPGSGPHTIVPGSVYSITSGDLHIAGPLNESVIVDGNNAVQLFSQGSGAASSFSNLTLRRGNAGAAQGGAYRLTTPVVSTAVIRNVTFEGNFGSQGGAIARTNFSNLVLRDCQFEGNSATFTGGAVFAGGTGTIDILGCSFTGNSGQGAGAANILTSSTFRIENSLFEDNFTAVGPSSLDGGALLVNSSTGVIANSTFFNNRALGRGGALHAQTGTISLLNVTMVGNESDTDANTGPTQGGAIGKGGSATVSVGNSLIAGNLDSGAANDLQDAAAFVSLGRNFIGEIGTATGFNADDADPLTGGADLSLASLGNPSLSSIYIAPPTNNGGATNTIALAPGSPLIDIGDAAVLALDVNDLDADGDVAEAIPYDQRGGDGTGPATEYPRVLGVAPDTGAYEGVLSPLSIVVDTVADNDDNDLSAGNLSLREAVRYVSNGGTITFDPAVFGVAQTINLTLGQFLVSNKGFTVEGPGRDLLTVRNPTSRVFNMSTAGDCPLTISDLTLAESGNAGVNGGAITTESALTARRVRFRDNQSLLGGGLALVCSGATGLSWTIDQCEFDGNSGNAGGAIFSQNRTAVTSTLTVRDSLFVGNQGVFFGGAIQSVASFVGAGNILNTTISNSTFSGNQITGAGSGGGAVAASVASGGAQSNATLVNCTVTGNAANSANGGGVFVSAPGATLTLRNSIVAGNTAASGPDIRSASAGATSISGGNLIGNDTGISTPVVSGTNVIGTGGSPVNPVLGPLADNGGLTRTHGLLTGSPALNLGDVAFLPADVNDLDADANVAEAIPYDQRGGDGAGPGADFRRIVGTAPDAGAFEALPTNLIVTTTGDLPDNNPGDGICNDGTGLCSLRAAVEESNAIPGANIITFDIPGPGPHTILNGSAFVPVANGDDLTITGPTDEEVTVDALGNWRHFEIGNQGDYAISNLILAGGRAFFDEGGSILVAAGAATLSLDGVRLISNSADNNGGAIRAGAGTSLLVTNCVLGGNRSLGQSGGAISSNAAVTYISRSVFGGNQAFFDGGAILTTGSLLVDGCAFETNSALDGGAIAFGGGSCRINNSMFYNNTASSEGGALYSPTLDMRFTHCTIVGNVAGTGGGAWVANTPAFVNSIVAGNTGGDVFGTVDSTNSRHNFIGDLTGSTGFNADDADPFTGGRDLSLASLGNPPLASVVELAPVLFGGRTRVLRVPYGSPLIDAGSDADIAPDTVDIDGDSNGVEPVPYDQRHFEPNNPARTFARVAGVRTDIGSYEAQPFVVDVVTDLVDANPGDGFCEDANGDCSLRAAIMESNANADTSLILFNIPGAGPHTIQPLSILPTVLEPVTIDATSEPDHPAVVLADFADVPIVELRGNLIAAPVTHGLTIQADDVAVRGLAINSFTGNGIMVANGAERTTLRGNYIGTTRDGLAIAPNGIHGVETFVGGADLVVGGTGPEDGNLISGNTTNGINLSDAASNAIIIGNRIGPDRTGNAALANVTADAILGAGIAVFGPNVTVGGANAGEGNVLSGNHGAGVFASGTAATNLRIVGNRIGIGADGTTGVGTQSNGVQLSVDLVGAEVGGDTPGERNVISGNVFEGVLVAGTNGTTITGNYIGTNAAGSAAVPNGREGIELIANAINTRIGGTAAGEGNVISGNTQDGINTGSSNLTAIQGNVIGLDATGTNALANGQSGVDVDGSSFVAIGGNVDAARNIISSNTQSGIVGRGGATGLLVRRNWIGLAADGTTARVNTGDGIQLQDADGAVIGGVSFDDRNTIVGQSDGIEVQAGSTGTDILNNRIGVSADGLTPLPSTQRAILVQGGGTEIFGNHLASAGGSILNISNVPAASVQNNLIGTNAGGAIEAGFGTTSVAVAVSNSTNVFIGGVGAGVGNTIAGAGQQGIALGAGTNNAVVLGNSIFGNGALGIDLGADGITLNDGLLDADAGINGLQNFPIILSAPAGGVSVAGRLESDANTIFRIELFTNTSCDGSGNGEGQTLLDSFDVGTGPTGLINWQRNVPIALPTGTILTATATHPINGTSEFSPCFSVPTASLVVDIITDEDDGDLAPGDVSLREAVANVADGGTVTFDPVVFGVPQTINLTLGEIAVTGPRAITVTGPGMNLLTVRNDTIPQQRVVHIPSNGSLPVVLTDMTLADGSVGIAPGGGAILSYRPLTMRRLRFLNNSANPEGGAVALIGVGTPPSIYPYSIDRCEFDGNTSAFGGALHAQSLNPSATMAISIRDSLFVGNSAGLNGGAVTLYPFHNTGLMQAQIVNCTFSGNSATNGGAIDVFPTSLSATAIVEIINSTITNNEATSGDGGGIRAEAPAGIDLRLYNSIVAGNTASGSGPDISSLIAGSVRFEGGNVIGNNADINAPVISGTNVIGTPGTPVNPQLAALANNGGPTRTHALLAGSPALDLGDPASLPGDAYDLDADSIIAEGIPYDQRGGDGAGAATDYPRIFGAAPDAGAFESLSQDIIVDIVADENDGNLTPGDVSFREAVLNVPDGASLLFDPVVFGVPQTINLTLGQIQVTGARTINIVGPGRDLLTVQSGTVPRQRILDIVTADTLPTTISGITFANSGLAGSTIGGAILTRSNLTLRDMRLSGNQGANGAGVYSELRANTSLVFTRTVFTGNASTGSAEGGAIHTRSLVGGGTPTVLIDRCEFDGNSAPFGGALSSRSFFDGSVTDVRIVDSLFVGNTAADGGALEILPGNLVSNNTINVTAVNSTFSGNVATGVGGAIDLFPLNGLGNGTVTLVNSTITANTAGVGGGIWSRNLYVINIQNSIVAGNTATTSAPDLRITQLNGLTVSGGSLLGNDSGINGYATAGTNVIGTAGAPVDPRLLALADNGGPTRTHALRWDSPAINLGDAALLPADVNDLDGDLNVAEAIPYDQRGGNGAAAGIDFLRNVYGAPDAGAFELPTYIVNVVTDAVDANPGDGIAVTAMPGETSLRSAIQESNAAPGPELVAFDIPGAGPHIIGINGSGLGELPTVSGTIYIDATTEPNHPSAVVAGFTDNPVVSLDYVGAPGVTVGIAIAGADCLVRGLHIADFGTDSIRFDAGADRGTVLGCYLAANLAGTNTVRNGQSGILFLGGDDHRVGGAAEEEGNLIGVSNFAAVNATAGVGTGLTIQGNRVGVRADGTAGLISGGLPVQGFGFNLQCNNALVGGGAPGQGNVVAQTNQAAIRLVDSDNCRISGNRIGTTPDGSTAVGFSREGILLSGSATSNVIGTNADGTTDATEGNLVSGGLGIGGGSAVVLSGATTTGNIVAGNILGLNAAGSADISSFQPRGVYLIAGANNNQIGGALAVQRNIISGNLNVGIELNSSPDNVIQGNYIGTDITGTVDLGNGLDGIRVGNLSPRTLIGTDGNGVDDATEGNLVSGNNGQGISISSTGPGNESEDCVLAGNTVGLSTTGTALANSLGGVGLSPGAVNARVGGALAAERNVVSGNVGAGISATAAGTTILNNYVGTDPTGLLPRPNNTGIVVSGGAAGAVIGGPGANEGNLISGNATNGAQLLGVTGAALAGNVIGLAADGLTPLGNGGSGVNINGATGTTIGGSTDAHRNVIAGNLFHGITASGNATGLVIRRNWIGLAIDGITAARNNATGVNLVDASGAIVGGATFDDRNVIVAQGDAVFVDAATANAEILRNRIGASADGTTPLISNLRGIHLAGNNATVVGNHVARTNLSYIRVVNSSGHTIQGNLLGTNAAGVPAIGFGGNSGGVAFSNATNIDFGGIGPGEGNTLVSAAQEGVGLAGTTNNVRVRGNAIYANGQLGIDINADGVTANDAGDGDAGPNAVQNYPTITGYTVGGTNVAGSLNSEANTTFDIDLFLNNAADVSGFGEGEIYIGSTTVTTDGVGNGTFNVVIPPANIPGAAFTTTSILTATATHPTNGTSEFSANFIEADPFVDPISSTDVVDGGVTATCPVKLTITFSEAVTDFDASDMEVSANAAVFAVTQVTPQQYIVEVRPLATTPLPALVTCRVNGSVIDLGNNPAAVVSALFSFTQNAPPTNWNIAAGDVYGPTGLVAAMDAANCSNDPNTITLAYRATYSPNVVDNTLGGIPAYGDNALPLVETPITIEADGSTLSASAIGTRLLAVVPSGSLTLNRATLSNNGPANQGAAILNRGRLEVVESYFLLNSATQFGGAIASPQVASVTRLIRSTFDTNTASISGGALFIAGNVGGADTNVLENLTVVGNVAANNGGGAHLSGTTDVRSSTFASNTVGGAGFGGGLYATTTIDPVTVTMANTIVAQNSANFGPDVFVDLNPNLTTTSLGYNLVGDNTFGFAGGVGDLLGTTATPIDPVLGTMTATGWVPTRTPLATSPARDAADPSLAALPETDARRVPRGLGLLNDRADIGAVELNDFPTAPIENIHAIGQQKEFWLMAAVADANLIDNGGAEPDTINLTTVDGSYLFDGRPRTFTDAGANYLPTLTSRVALVGNDATLDRSPFVVANARFQTVGTGSELLASRVTYRNGLAAGAVGERLGGALFVRGRLEVTESSFFNNRANQGGALFFSATGASPHVVRRSTLADNIADASGGAMQVQFVSPSLLIENSTISNNDALAGNGGGVLVRSNTTFSNATIVLNSASASGGGVAIELSGTGRFRNTLVAQNTAAAGPDIRLTAPGVLVDERYNLLGNNSLAGGVLVNNVNGNLVGTPATPINPQIGPLANNGGPTLTHELLSNSPAVDRIPFAAGAPNTSLLVDQRNSPRPRRFGYDIGAYERFAYFVPCGDIAALRQAINDSNALPNLDEIFLDNNPCATGYPIADVDNVTDGPNGLPVITSPINIFGLNNTVSRSTVPGTPDLRLFYVGTGGNVTFQNNISLVGGRLVAPGIGSAQSGAALLNRGIVRFQGTNNLYNNEAAFGGAIANEFNGNLNIQVGTTLRDNIATAGGAIANWLGGTAGLRNVVIRNNTALFFGGGYLGSVQSTNNLSLVSVTDNHSFGYGGGIYIADENTNVFLENITVGRNSADLEGGGIYIGPRLFGNFLMTFATVAENSAPLGGGIRYQAPVNIGSSIIARNAASTQGPDFNGTVSITSLGYNLVGNNTGVAGFTGPGDLVGTAATPLDPRLSVLGNYAGFTSTYTLLAGSPALDAGHPTTFPPLDQRTFARPVSWSGVMPARPDIGAVEVQADDDRDGIPNSLETDNLATLRGNLGITNRYIPDSDADGLIDGDERYLHGTNPRFANSDADTLWDGTEIRLALENPALAAFVNPLVNNTGQFTDADADRLPEALNGVAVVADPAAGNDTDGDGFSDHYEFATYANNNDAGIVPPLADVDGAAGVTTNDATTIANFAVGNNPIPYVYANANANGDAIPDAADVTLINLWLFGEVPILR